MFQWPASQVGTAGPSVTNEILTCSKTLLVVCFSLAHTVSDRCQSDVVIRCVARRVPQRKG